MAWTGGTKEPLRGGNVSAGVVRPGDTVRRPAEDGQAGGTGGTVRMVILMSLSPCLATSVMPSLR